MLAAGGGDGSDYGQKQLDIAGQGSAALQVTSQRS